MNADVVEDVIAKIEEKFGKMVVTQGDTHSKEIMCIASGYHHFSKFLFELGNHVLHHISIHMRDLIIVDVSDYCALFVIDCFIGNAQIIRIELEAHMFQGVNIQFIP